MGDKEAQYQNNNKHGLISDEISLDIERSISEALKWKPNTQTEAVNKKLAINELIFLAAAVKKNALKVNYRSATGVQAQVMTMGGHQPVAAKAAVLIQEQQPLAASTLAA